MDIDNLKELAFNVVIALLIIILGWILSKWTKKGLLSMVRKSHIDETSGLFLATIFQYAIVIISFVVAFGTIGIQTASLVAVFASVGLALALALKGTLSDLASGIIILLFRPFSVGDNIKCCDSEGRVKEVGLFFTTIISEGDVKITLPNSQITKTTIETKNKT